MSHVCQLLEYSRAPVVDGVIKGVKIIGTRSKKGRDYPQAMLARAIPLYENAPVYIYHGSEREKRLGQRQHKSHFGHISNVHEGDDGLFGDLHVKQSHGMAGMIVESDGRDFGLSHNANCVLNDEKTEILDILRVDSVDLVDNPGTTKNLFEGDDQMTLDEMAAAQDAQAKQIKAITEGQGKIMALLEGMSAPPTPPAAKGRASALEQVDASDGDGEQMATFGHSRADFAAGLLGVAGGTE